ncbi:MAG TPA: response regulator transcription factor [Dehalococcoidia bacterium]|nr:response regulator transcription factor [Dehalococcoidia bacterium]
MSQQIRVMIVDDHEIVREGLRALVHREPTMCLVGEGYSADSAIAEAKRTQPDVIVMDVRLGDKSGIEACREIRAQNSAIKVMMLTSYPDEEAVFASILAGASGYLLKQTRRQTLIEAIAAVARGESLLDSAVTSKVLECLRTGTPQEDHELSLLTGQEQRILGLIACGKTNKEIAHDLRLSPKTVKNYVSSILSKMSFRRRSEAAAFMARHSAPPAHERTRWDT